MVSRSVVKLLRNISSSAIHEKLENPGNPSSSKLNQVYGVRDAHFPRFCSFLLVSKEREKIGERKISREEVVGKEREMAREAPLDIVTDSPRFSFSSGSCN